MTEIDGRLTRIFANPGTSYPHIEPRATISTRNAEGTGFSAETTTPEQTAQVLSLFGSQQGLFARAPMFRACAPLSLKMNMIFRGEDPAKAQALCGLTMAFRDNEKHSWVWTAGTSGQWRGPSLDETVDAFARAGRDWHKTNFIFRANGGHLRLVR